MKRAILGILGGALFGGVIAAAIPSVLFGANFLYYLIFPEHSQGIIHRSGQVLFIAAFYGVIGIIPGALAGAASRIPAAGISFLRCCIFVALAAAAARLLTAPGSIADQSYSYIATFIAAVIVTGVLICVGLKRKPATQDMSPPTESATTLPPKPNRRWYEFSLKTLMIVMTLFAMTVGWVGYRVQRAQQNRQRIPEDEKRVRQNAIDEFPEEVAGIERLGGGVSASYSWRRDVSMLEWILDDPGGPDDPTFYYVISVDGGPTFGDDGLAYVGELKSLESLELEKTIVTDDGLRHLKGLANLEYLDLTDTHIGDAGLKHLKGLESIGWLVLDGTNVTDAGLEHLTGMTELYVLSLRSTNVTQDGLNTLRLALPNCSLRPLIIDVDDGPEAKSE